jgi:hypothetical protein
MHCGRFAGTPVSRRQMLVRCANGFGAVALAALRAERASGAPGAPEGATNPLAPRPTHFPPRATRVIFLYMDGGPSQVDTFDPKPRLDREHGQPIGMKVPATQFNNVGKVLASPWKFRRYGESGLPVSDLFPHVATCIDDLCVIRSMVSNFSEHTGANYFLHTGFLPASFQGSVFKAGKRPVADITRTEPSEALQRSKLQLLHTLDRGVLGRLGESDALEAAIANDELAFRMQAAVPGLMDIGGESPATRRLYGLDAPYAPTQTFGTLCLIARRLVERGVRLVELTCPNVGADRWDQHSNLKQGHEDNARAVDQPIAGLLKDLRARGLLDSTLVLWGGEFGRTPMAQGADGRDHNPYGFTIWMAGAGIKGGMAYGATDEYGYFAVEDKVEVHDLHATLLHLLGLDHKRLTFRFGGRDMRLTDVHGEVIREILA